ncbi:MULTISPECIES: efflux RND transporter periplasmic adaptor subunit [unclassified Herbaspirillum]|uniref:efflux RND transporter periplasmic adaptor subunit n=1 Tax=unclassified Herbaspirillum TaxID=2624150 RepID=UPI001621C74E|nr:MULTISPECIES: efflux RND transporter periplasmic adaptor subunit [unclassified Herbaspirillum]
MLTLIGMLVACHDQPPTVVAPHEVVVLPAQTISSSAQLQLPAELQARFTTPMSFRVAGQLLERRVHLGDKVHRGDILARLDAVDAEQNAASAAADLSAARQHLEAAEKQWQRDTAQAQEKLISSQQLEQTQDAYAAAQSQFKSAQARATVADNQHRYTNLVSPHDGVITAELADTGAVLTAGQAVFSLAWSGATDITTEAAENQVTKIQVGAPSVLTLSALPAGRFTGHVREISPAADPQSRTYRIKVTLDDVDPALRLGMTGVVAIDTGTNAAAGQAIRVPSTALFHQGDRPAVWIVRADDSKLELRTVTVSTYGERSVTISSGLAAGEKIVVQGVHTLTAGDKVNPVAPLHAEDFAS